MKAGILQKVEQLVVTEVPDPQSRTHSLLIQSGRRFFLPKAGRECIPQCYLKIERQKGGSFIELSVVKPRWRQD